MRRVDVPRAGSAAAEKGCAGNLPRVPRDHARKLPPQRPHTGLAERVAPVCALDVVLDA